MSRNYKFHNPVEEGLVFLSCRRLSV